MDHVKLAVNGTLMRGLRLAQIYRVTLKSFHTTCIRRSGMICCKR